MNLSYYREKFANLRRNPNRKDGPSPHKPAMLLAVIDMIEAGLIHENRIWFNDHLKQAFTNRLDSFKSNQDRNTPHLPFFYLRGGRNNPNSFWHHQIIHGRELAYRRLAKCKQENHVTNNILYAYLDDALYEYIRNPLSRSVLKEDLINTAHHNNVREMLTKGNEWDLLDYEALVADYFSMLYKEVSGRGFNKSQHRRLLKAKLNHRSEPAIENKHRNISAILVQAGQPYIRSYTPTPSFPEQLRSVVFAYLAGNSSQIENIIHSIENKEPLEFSTEWDHIVDLNPPKKIPKVINSENRRYDAKQINFAEREQVNRNLGEDGERFVFCLERRRMISAGHPEFVDRIKWISKDEGDGKGYDILSVNLRTGDDLSIEVKTTRGGKYQPFFITDNELAYSKEFSDSYCLYRLYDFNLSRRLFRLCGAVDQHVNLDPKSFKASFS